MNKHINKHRVASEKSKKNNKVDPITLSGGNRHQRRASVAIERLAPYKSKVFKAEQDVYNKKVRDRAKLEKHLDKVRAKTIKRKSELKANKNI